MVSVLGCPDTLTFIVRGEEWGMTSTRAHRLTGRPIVASMLTNVLGLLSKLSLSPLQVCFPLPEFLQSRGVGWRLIVRGVVKGVRIERVRRGKGVFVIAHDGLAAVGIYR